MYFKGMHKTSFVDYPGKMATVLFTGGCNFRCPYCHNGHLVQQLFEDHISEEDVFTYLAKRRGIIEAVVVSGGEPTLWGKELILFLAQLKEKGLFVKIDTNGTSPELLNEIIVKKLIDYIAMDIKAPLEKYDEVVKVHIDPLVIKASIGAIKASGIDYEFRTTACRELTSKEDLIQISHEIAPYNHYFVQNFHDGDYVLEGKGQFTPFETLDDLTNQIPVVIR